jgi:predicted site-specific integrase-resolvase
VSDAILLPPEQASTVTGIPVRLIYRWVEAGTIHYREAPNEKLTVCVKTLRIAGKTSTEA